MESNVTASANKSNRNEENDENNLMVYNLLVYGKLHRNSMLFLEYFNFWFSFVRHKTVNYVYLACIQNRQKNKQQQNYESNVEMMANIVFANRAKGKFKNYSKTVHTNYNISYHKIYYYASEYNINIIIKFK